jgi:hypothetical protein
VGDPTKLGPEIWEETLASNAWYLNSAEVQNLYTPIMFAKYAEDLCISSHGWTCPAAAGKLFETDTGTGKVLADLLSVDTIQLLRDPEAPSGDRGLGSGQTAAEYRPTRLDFSRNRHFSGVGNQP